MILKEYGKFTPACDGCEVTLAKEDNFQEATDAIRGADWSTKKDGDDWINLCPTCQKEENK
jgi:hypothetical protein